MLIQPSGCKENIKFLGLSVAFLNGEHNIVGQEKVHAARE